MWYAATENDSDFIRRLCGELCEAFLCVKKTISFSVLQNISPMYFSGHSQAALLVIGKQQKKIPAAAAAGYFH